MEGIKNLMAGKGWDKETPRAIMCHTLDSGASIVGSKWMLLVNIPKRVRSYYTFVQGKAEAMEVKASQIWLGVKAKDLVISFSCDDLEEFRLYESVDKWKLLCNRFPNMSNVSSWLDLEQVGHTWTIAGQKIKSTQARKMGAGNLSVRYTEEIDIWLVT